MAVRENPSFWEVFLPPQQAGQRRVERGRFWEEEDALYVCDYLNRLQPSDGERYVYAKVTLEVKESGKTYVDMLEASERARALAKLSTRERELLGISSD